MYRFRDENDKAGSHIVKPLTSCKQESLLIYLEDCWKTKSLLQRFDGQNQHEECSSHSLGPQKHFSYFPTTSQRDNIKTPDLLINFDGLPQSKQHPADSKRADLVSYLKPPRMKKKKQKNPPEGTSFHSTPKPSGVLGFSRTTEVWQVQVFSTPTQVLTAAHSSSGLHRADERLIFSL